jgi:MFS family permease
MDERSFRYRGWRVTLACFTMALFGYGLGLHGHGVFLAELTTGLAAGAPKLTTSIVSAATTLYYLVSALLVVFVSDAITRLGPRLVTTMGAVALALSASLISRIKAPVDVFIAYLTMSLAWATLTNAAITNILSLWFREKRGLAISFALNGASVGGGVIAPLLVWLNGRMPFASTMQLVAITTLLILLITIFLWIDQPASELQGGTNNSTKNQTDANVATEAITRLGALASTHFWTISTPFALGLTAQVGFIVHQVAFLFPLVGREGAALAVAAMTIMAFIGRVGLGLFIDRLDQRRVAALLLAAQAVALFAMSRSTNPLVLYVASAIFGFSAGNIVTLPALIIQREYPAAAFGMLSALVVAIIQVTFAFGPGLLGLLRDATGSYAASFVFCMVLELVGAAVVLLRIGRA